VSFTRKSNVGSFSVSLLPVVALGALLTGCFYGLILTGPLDFALLRRYCLSHWVAITSVSMFFVAAVVLFFKWSAAMAQFRVIRQSVGALSDLVADGQSTIPADRPKWLEASWMLQPAAWQRSWFGNRVSRILDLQIKRGKRDGLERDLQALSEADADKQHDSYSLVRIITWAMPMLGFLGTVLGISETLGTLDTKMLASQSQEAMNQLTAGLYVAFDTTAIALVLTVIAMFIQFAVSRIELALLAQIDAGVQDTLIEFLATDLMDAEDSLFAPVRIMTSDLITAVHQLVEQQANLWSRSIAESQRQWTNWTQTASQRIESGLGETITQALQNHADRMETIQEEGARQIDTRWHQWQLTLSEQARAINSQQKEMIRQSVALESLVASTCDLRKLEETIQESVARIEDTNRIEQASHCIVEAVAMLATSLERAGVIRGAPIRPRSVRKPDLTVATESESDDELQQRKAA
jgi:biopolymer transport protein ExbB/TolQ